MLGKFPKRTSTPLPRRMTWAASGILAAAVVALLFAPRVGAAELDLDNDPIFDEYRAVEEGKKDGEAPPIAPITPDKPITPITLEPIVAQAPPGGVVTEAALSKATPEPSPKEPLLAVIDLDSETVGTTELRSIGRALHSGFAMGGAIAVLPQRETRERLEEADLLPHDPYNPTPGRDELALGAGADYIVTGTLDHVADSYILQTTLYDARADEIVQIDTQTAKGGLAELVARIPEATRTLSKGLPAKALREPPTLGKAGPAPKTALATEPLVTLAPSAVSLTPGAPEDPLEAAKQQVEGLLRRIRKLESDLIEQKAQSRRYQLQASAAHEALAAARKAEPTPGPTSPPASPPTPTPTPTPDPTYPSEMDRAADKEKARELASAAAKEGVSPAERLANLETAANLDPDVVEYHHDLAQEHYNQRNYISAKRACDRGIAAHPSDAKLRLLKGATYMAEEDFPHAEKCFREALSISPTDAYAQYNLAVVVERDAARKEEALSEWRRYLEIAPTDPRQEAEGRVDEARRHIKALEEPAPPPAHSPQPTY
jgi:tetratricopeptide (TPR) repeat protein